MMNINNVSVGVDIESISRFKDLDRKRDRNFLNNIFTEKELEYCYLKKEPAQHLAARFTGKEAIIKASSGAGLKPLRYNKIEILNNKKGAPCVHIRDDGWNKDHVFKISISHCNDKALAFAVIGIKNL